MRQHQPYSRHSIEELEAVRNVVHSPMLREFHARRIEWQVQSVSVMLDNVRYRLSEISDLMDDAQAGEDAERVSFRELLETLRSIEVELEAAVGRLAGELGLVAM